MSRMSFCEQIRVVHTSLNILTDELKSALMQKERKLNIIKCVELKISDPNV